MRIRHLHVLCCPECRSDLAVRSADEQIGDDVVDGELECTGCARTFAIRERIPVFAETTESVEMFGWQWSQFNKLQRDDYNGTDMVRKTILRRTGWSPEHLRDRAVLECGCGSGNDTGVLSTMAKLVVSLDLSYGVHSFDKAVLERENVLAMQANLLNAPVKRDWFDVVYCHRVIHHTPDPATSFRAIARHMRPGGELFLECYSRHWKSMLNFKYVWRPLTTRMSHAAVHRALRVAGPFLYVLHGVLNRIAFLRRVNQLVIPFEYHTRMMKKLGTTLSMRELYDYSLLVTFDALTPTYDNPQHAETIRGWCEELGLEDIEQPWVNPVITRARRPLLDRQLEPAGQPAQAGERSIAPAR